MPDQVFVLGSDTLVVNSTSHLGQVKAFAPGRILRFDNMEYTTDLRGELIFSGLASCRIEGQ